MLPRYQAWLLPTYGWYVHIFDYLPTYLCMYGICMYVLFGRHLAVEHQKVSKAGVAVPGHIALALGLSPEPLALGLLYVVYISYILYISCVPAGNIYLIRIFTLVHDVPGGYTYMQATRNRVELRGNGGGRETDVVISIQLNYSRARIQMPIEAPS